MATSQSTKMKRCCQCRRRRRLEFFYKDRTRPDGLNPYCTACLRARRTRPQYQGKHAAAERARRARDPAAYRLADAHPARRRKQAANSRARYARDPQRMLAAKEAAYWKDPEKARERKRARYPRDLDAGLQRTYGLALAEYNARLAAQDGVCAVCRCPETLATGRKHCRRKPNRLAVDHDHTTGRVRGLLCHRCNVVLGYVRDDPVLLQGLITYLQQC